MECWAASLDARLSQGDIVRLTPLATLPFPSTMLEKTTLSGGRVAWSQVSEPKKSDVTFLAEGRYLDIIVLSHSCELDKSERKSRVTVAPVLTASALPDEAKKTIFEYRRLSLLPLPNVPGIGDSYADLRLAQAIDRRHVDNATRLVSMTADGVALLKRHIVGFFARP